MVIEYLPKGYVTAAKRKAFLKGAAAGFALAVALGAALGAALYALAPTEMYRGVAPTKAPERYQKSEFPKRPLPPCDTRGKDCVYFADPAQVHYVSEPGTLLMAATAVGFVAYQARRKT